MEQETREYLVAKSARFALMQTAGLEVVPLSRLCRPLLRIRRYAIGASKSDVHNNVAIPGLRVNVLVFAKRVVRLAKQKRLQVLARLRKAHLPRLRLCTWALKAATVLAFEPLLT